MAINKQVFDDIVGLTVQEAEKALVTRGIKEVRVTREGDQYVFVTNDFREDRINVWLDGGKIIAETGLG